MQILTTKQYAARNGLNWRRVQRMCREGRIPQAQRVGRYWCIPENSTVLINEIELPTYLIGGTPYPEPQYRRPGAKIGHEPYNTANLIRTPGLYRIRTEQGLSVRGLWRITGCSQDTIRRAEQGQRVRPGTVLKLARGLGCDPTDLMRKG